MKINMKNWECVVECLEKNNKEKASVRNESEKTGGNIDDFWTD